MHYPGSTSKCKALVTIYGVQLVDERDPARIDVIYNGTRQGTYMTSVNLDGAVELILLLEAAVADAASRSGFTHPAFVRLAEHRRSMRPVR